MSALGTGYADVVFGPAGKLSTKLVVALGATAQPSYLLRLLTEEARYSNTRALRR